MSSSPSLCELGLSSRISFHLVSNLIHRFLYSFRFYSQYHVILIVFSLFSVDPTDQKKTACYDIDVEVDDPLKSQMNSFLSSTTNQQEIAALEMKVN